MKTTIFLAGLFCCIAVALATPIGTRSYQFCALFILFVSPIPIAMHSMENIVFHHWRVVCLGRDTLVYEFNSQNAESFNRKRDVTVT